MVITSINSLMIYYKITTDNSTPKQDGLFLLVYNRHFIDRMQPHYRHYVDILQTHAIPSHPAVNIGLVCLPSEPTITVFTPLPIYTPTPTPYLAPQSSRPQCRPSQPFISVIKQRISRSNSTGSRSGALISGARGLARGRSICRLLRWNLAGSGTIGGSTTRLRARLNVCFFAEFASRVGVIYTVWQWV